MTIPTTIKEVQKRSAWAIFMGVLTAALGLFLIVYPLAAATITSVLLGWLLIFVGLAQLVFALYSQTVGNFFLKVLSSFLYGAAGMSLAVFPIAGVAALTGILGALFLAQAAVLTAIAFRLRPMDGWGWFLADAVTALLPGILILANWPSSSVWAIGTLIGVSVLMSGISKIIVTTKLRRAAVRVERFTQAA